MPIIYNYRRNRNNISYQYRITHRLFLINIAYLWYRDIAHIYTYALNHAGECLPGVCHARAYEQSYIDFALRLVSPSLSCRIILIRFLIARDSRERCCTRKSGKLRATCELNSSLIKILREQPARQLKVYNAYVRRDVNPINIYAVRLQAIHVCL